MFTPEDIHAVRNGTASRGTLLAVLTSQTCGEPCWMASELICRCSCGGANHGCLSNETGIRPERTSRIDGELYRFKAVGEYNDLQPLANEINRLAGYRSIERPTLCVDGEGRGELATPETLATYRAQGKDVWISQYYYTWSQTDAGAPARLKTASPSQRKWIEMKGWQNTRSLYILWERIAPVDPPSILLLDKKTALPLACQLPN